MRIKICYDVLTGSLLTLGFLVVLSIGVSNVFASCEDTSTCTPAASGCGIAQPGQCAGKKCKNDEKCSDCSCGAIANGCECS